MSRFNKRIRFRVVLSFFVFIALLLIIWLPTISSMSEPINDSNATSHMSKGEQDISVISETELLFKPPNNDNFAPISSRDILKWKADTSENSYISTPALVDLNGNGELEVVFITDADVVYALDNTGEILWRRSDYSFSRADEFMSAASAWYYLLPIFSSITPADIQGDDDYELLFGAKDYVVCLDSDGKEVWKNGETNRHFISTPAVTNLAGINKGTKTDQAIVVLKDNNYQQVFPEAYSTSGNNIWTLPRPSQWNQDVGMASVGVFDLDGSEEPDTKQDLIFGNRYSPMRLYSDNGNGYDRIIPDNTWVACLTYGTGAVGDFVGDSELEYFIGTYQGSTGLSNPINSQGFYYLYDPINSSANTEVDYRLWTKNLVGTGTGFLGSPAVGDVHCGRPSPTSNKLGYEGFLGSYNGKLYCIDIASGDILWSFDTGDSITSSPALCNINANNTLEVIVASNDGMIYCLDGDPADGIDEGIMDNGSTDYDILWEYDTGGNGAWVSSPVVADIDNDKNLEVVIGDIDGNVWCLIAGPTPIPGQRDWTMFQHDKQNTGVYPTKQETFDISFELLNGDGPNNDTCYARYKPYKFRAIVSDGFGFEELNNVILSFDPTGENIQCQWSSKTDTFKVLNDPYDSIEVVSTKADTITDTMQTWTIDFQIIFNWTFDYKFPVACSLKCNGYANPARTVYYNNFLLVENNIDFTGELLITSDAQGELEEGAWVKGGDTIHWSNLSVIYENTDNIYLNNTLITVSISDEDDNVWTNDLTSPGETINITTIMAEATYMEREFVFNITNVPPSSFSPGINRKVVLRLDNTLPKPPGQVILHADSFSDTHTAADNDTMIFATWTSSNEEFSGISGYYYSSEDLGGTNLGTFTDKTHVQIDTLKFGEFDLYVWAVDHVGNIGPANHATIFLDNNEIEFLLNEYPYWFNKSIVKVSISITDNQGIGVDPATIQYSITTSGSESFDIWNSINQATDLTWHDENKTDVDVESSIRFPDNGINYIKWRAKDLAGNGFTESIFNQIMVDDQLPLFKNSNTFVPDDSLPHRLVCNITIVDDGGSGIDLTSIQYKYSKSGVENFSSWLNVKNVEVIVPTNVMIELTLTFEYGSNNFIHWRCNDQAGNGFATSGDIRIIINTPPVIKITLPVNNSRNYIDDKLEFDARGSYDPDDTDAISFYWETKYTSGQGHQNTEGVGKSAYFLAWLPSGSNIVTLYVDDGTYNISSKNIFIFVYDQYTDLDKDGMPDWWEIQYVGLDLEDPSDAFNDLDGDTVTNIDEYRDQTNPVDPKDYLGADVEEKSEKEDTFTSITSNPLILLNLIAIIVVIILLVSIGLFKRSKIKKARMEAIRSGPQVVLLRREAGESTYGTGGKLRGLGTTQVIPRTGASSTIPSTQTTPAQVPKQEPVPQLPPHQPIETSTSDTTTKTQPTSQKTPVTTTNIPTTTPTQSKQTTQITPSTPQSQPATSTSTSTSIQTQTSSQTPTTTPTTTDISTQSQTPTQSAAEPKISSIPDKNTEQKNTGNISTTGQSEGGDE